MDAEYSAYIAKIVDTLLYCATFIQRLDKCVSRSISSWEWNHIMTTLGRCGFAAVAASLFSGLLITSASASVYTSSAAFNAATAGSSFTVEQYATGTPGQTIVSGGSFDGLTYSFAAGPIGTLTGGIITNNFNSFSGNSLGGTQISGEQYFFGGDSVTVTFPEPVTAVGVFFNVNANSGNYDVNSLVGNASTGSAAFDTNTFVFDGITSTTPFSTITIFSESVNSGSYNIPEIEFVAATPLPATLPLFAGGLGFVGYLTRRRKKNGTQGLTAA